MERFALAMHSNPIIEDGDILERKLRLYSQILARTRGR